MQVVLQTSEVADVKLIMPEVGLKVIGFVPTSELLDFYQVKRSSFIYPDEEVGTCYLWYQFFTSHKPS